MKLRLRRGVQVRASFVGRAVATSAAAAAFIIASATTTIETHLTRPDSGRG